MKKAASQRESGILTGLFRENEIKTNKIASVTILIAGLFFMLLSHLDKIGVYNLGIELCRWYLFLAGLINVAIFVVAVFKDYKPTWLKRLIIAGIVTSSAVVFNFYPLNAPFIVYGPIIISAMYYDRSTIHRTALYCWILFTVLLWGNVLADAKLGVMYELHVIQQITIWSMPEEVLADYQIPHTVFFVITGIICDGIARRGREFVEKQAQITAEVSSIETELKTASGIQLASMPAPAYSSEDGSFSCNAYIRPAKQVGGDFYDYFSIGHETVILIGDVSDKGLSAAMFMMRAKNEIRNAVSNCDNLALAVAEANDALCADNSDNMFVTLWIARVNVRTGIGKCVNCGHLPPYVRHSDCRIEKIEVAPDVPMGIFEGSEFKAYPIVLKSDESLLIYTDGFIDAENRDGERFGFQRLEEELVSCDSHDDICGFAASQIDSFADGTAQYDDMTALCFHLYSTENVQKKTIRLSSDNKATSALIDTVNHYLSENDCPEYVRRNIDVALDEICDNISSYAFPDSECEYSMSFSVGENYAEFVFRDSGIPFNPLEAAAPEETDEPAFGGLGILLTKEIMDKMDYSYSEGENLLRMLKIWE